MNIDTFITNDLSFAAYLTMHGMEMMQAKRMGKTYKFTFKESTEIESLRFKYIRSESAKFDDSVRKIKKLLFGDN